MNYTKNCTGIYEQHENPVDWKQFAHFTQDEDGLKVQKLDSFRPYISKQWQKEATEVQPSPMSDLNKKDYRGKPKVFLVQWKEKCESKRC